MNCRDQLAEPALPVTMESHVSFELQKRLAERLAVGRLLGRGGTGRLAPAGPAKASPQPGLAAPHGGSCNPGGEFAGYSAITFP